MRELMIITAVKKDSAEALRCYLRRLGDASVSPFSGALPPTHFGRFVVIKLGDLPHLLFSSRFDGTVDAYVRALAKTELARKIWCHCELPPDDQGADGRLERYLTNRRHHVKSQYVVSAFPLRSTVAEINAALRLRAELSKFAVRAAKLDQIALAHDFRQLPSIRHIMSRG
jgi:hypothetical protein